ncbi:hypothetical protein SAMN05421636_11091 [Pricia antarctica]|uniref:Uncharacterized protein n=1 Tax=Pricia antarctica TaxID=641691 RepID=A0A1G7HXN8_9FLAO|nr:hypothetical protein SAMN05421636_11091 [Pricia antarctica]
MKILSKGHWSVVCLLFLICIGLPQGSSQDMSLNNTSKVPKYTFATSLEKQKDSLIFTI